MSYEYLDDERKKLWSKVIELEKLIKEKTSDNEEEILANLEKSKEYLVQIEEIHIGVSKNKEKIDEINENIISKSSEIDNSYSEIKPIFDKISSVNSAILSSGNDIKNIYDNVKDIYSELENIASNNQEMENKLKKFNEMCVNLENVLAKIKSTNQLIINQKQEIDIVYYSIMGNTETNEKGETINKTDGLKEKLEKAYDKIKADFISHQETADVEYNNMLNKISEFENEKKVEFDGRISEWKGEHDSLMDKINSLLPNALTTGLSYAFSEKKDQEIRERKVHLRVFLCTITLMVVFSLIPVGISIHSIINNVSLNEVISRIPRVVFAIVPIYIPLIWLAYSASKKLNLSKRLIEEYSHKEALSKTYEGLSTQIKRIEDSSGETDLMERLLFNILEATSQNPGKLISDYNKSDHPLMDALDKSIELSNKLEALSKLPGLSKIAVFLTNKAEKILQEQKNRAEQGLSSVMEETKDEDAKSNKLADKN